MSANLKRIKDHFCPVDSPDDPAFPNHTDSDIWRNGFEMGLKVATKAILGEYSETTQKWVADKIEIQNKIRTV